MDPQTFYTIAQQPRQPHKRGRGLLVFIIIFGLIMLSWQAVGLITDWFWYQEVGYEQVFTVTLTAQILVALLFGGAFFLIFYTNLYLASRLSERMQLIFHEGAVTLPPSRSMCTCLKGSLSSPRWS